MTENLTTTSNGTQISRDQDQEGTTQACTNSAKEVVLIAGQMMEHSAKGRLRRLAVLMQCSVGAKKGKSPTQNVPIPYGQREHTLGKFFFCTFQTTRGSNIMRTRDHPELSLAFQLEPSNQKAKPDTHVHGRGAQKGEKWLKSKEGSFIFVFLR